jgi:hypothetical protein
MLPRLFLQEPPENALYEVTHVPKLWMIFKILPKTTAYLPIDTEAFNYSSLRIELLYISSTCRVGDGKIG